MDIHEVGREIRRQLSATARLQYGGLICLKMPVLPAGDRARIPLFTHRR